MESPDPHVSPTIGIGDEYVPGSPCNKSPLLARTWVDTSVGVGNNDSQGQLSTQSQRGGPDYHKHLYPPNEAAHRADININDTGYWSFSTSNGSSQTGQSWYKDTYRCPYSTCEECCLSLSDLDNHIKEAHEQSLSCPYRTCSSYRDPESLLTPHSHTFDSSIQYLRHMKTVHDETPFPCLVEGCDRTARKGFEKEWHLRKHHIEAHAGRDMKVARSQSPLRGLAGGLKSFKYWDVICEATGRTPSPSPVGIDESGSFDNEEGEEQQTTKANDISEEDARLFRRLIAWILLREFVAGEATRERNNTGKTASSVTQKDHDEIANQPSSSEGSKRRRRGIEDGDGKNNDNDEDNGDDKRRRKASKTHPDPKGGPDEVLCPFFKYDSAKFSRCSGASFGEIHTLRTHLLRRDGVHGYPNACPTCATEFTDSEVKDTHIEARTCSPVSYIWEKQGKIGPDKKPKINAITGPHGPLLQKWHDLYSVLFPTAYAPPSPHRDTARALIQRLIDFFETHGPWVVEEVARVKSTFYHDNWTTALYDGLAMVLNKLITQYARNEIPDLGDFSPEQLQCNLLLSRSQLGLQTSSQDFLKHSLYKETGIANENGFVSLRERHQPHYVLPALTPPHSDIVVQQSVNNSPPQYPYLNQQSTPPAVDEQGLLVPTHIDQIVFGAGLATSAAVQTTAFNHNLNSPYDAGQAPNCLCPAPEQNLIDTVSRVSCSFTESNNTRDEEMLQENPQYDLDLGFCVPLSIEPSYDSYLLFPNE